MKHPPGPIDDTVWIVSFGMIVIGDDVGIGRFVPRPTIELPVRLMTRPKQYCMMSLTGSMNSEASPNCSGTSVVLPATWSLISGATGLPSSDCRRLALNDRVRSDSDGFVSSTA